MLIKNAIYLSAPVDLLCRAGKIVTMTPAGHCVHNDAGEIVDAAGLTLMPALIDCHTHMREPGQEYKEDIASGLSAASHGGFGAIMCMANTRPVNDQAAVTLQMQARARAAHPHGPRLYPVAAASKNLAGEELAPLAELKEAGCIAVSNDGRPLANTELVRRIMEYAADLGMTFIDHCEDPWLAKGWVMHEGPVSSALGLRGQPAAGEAIQASRDILLAECLGLPIHIAHVSSALTVDLIAWAKARGVKVTAETCPHYLLLDETCLGDYNIQAKVSPPLRSKADQQALRKAVADGTIDILATDHAPHASHEKNGTLDAIPPGFIGLELALPLTWELVRENVLQERDLHRLWCQRPGEIFGIPWNNFDPGANADFILYDPEEEWQVEKGNLYSKSCNTPFYGQRLKGRVKHHWQNGIQLF